MDILQEKFDLVAWNQKVSITLEELLKNAAKTLIYFYPEDNTPGCSKQAEGFTELESNFEELGIQTIGISKDTPESHITFIQDKNLSIPLISDPNLLLHNFFGAYGEKSMYGKKFMGVIRSTFILDQKWATLHEWRNVRATAHAEKILKEMKNLY